MFGLAVNELRSECPILDVISEEEKEEIPSRLALDLKISEYTKLDEFFNDNKGYNKVVFARKYVEVLSQGEFIVPNWIEEIKKFYVK